MVSETQLCALKAHIAGERAGDVEAAMAPLADHPTYALPMEQVFANVAGVHPVSAI